MNVLLINGHPRHNSLSEAFSDAYVKGALAAGAEVKRINVRDLDFDMHVRTPVKLQQSTEPAIAEARDMILWAEHIVFIFPVWWGSVPALLKGFIDRVFISGFAFEETEGGTGYASLLDGRTAQLIITLDTPYFVYKYMYGAPANNAMKKALLGFCGVHTAPSLYFGPVKSSTAQQRTEWISKVEITGQQLKHGSLPLRTRLYYRVLNWLQAIRLQFYPMTFMAYLLGSYAATAGGFSFDKTIFWIGYLWIFFLEVSTVLSNDYYDYNTDLNNEYYSPFTGGSRVLIEKRITPRSVKMGIYLFASMAFCALIYVLNYSQSFLVQTTIASSGLFLLALGYTIPPLKLVYRGLGEITVCLTHSFAVIFAGYLFQGGTLHNPFPWLLSIPLFLSIFPSIILAGVPDAEADKSVNKKTIAVCFGKRNAIKAALIITWLAVISILLIQYSGMTNSVFDNLLLFVIPHAVLISFFLIRLIRMKTIPNRIDAMMIVTLTYIIWFVLIPLLNIK